MQRGIEEFVHPERNKNQTVKSVIALFFLLSIVPEMPLREFIGLISIKMKEYERKTWVTRCNLLSWSIDTAEQLA